MQHEFVRAINHGKVVKSQSFVTDKGTYRIDLIKFEDYIYFAKYQNDKIVECCNLNKMKVNK